jgi:hypothetical protein
MLPDVLGKPYANFHGKLNGTFTSWVWREP